MGMYTGVRCKVVIKPEYHEMINELVNEQSDWKDLENSCAEISDWTSSFHRANFIPYGALSYMPDSWETIEALEEWEHSFIDGVWTFQCSLKNYEAEIEYFFDYVLAVITEKVLHLEKFYEEWTYGHLYDFVDGKLTEVNDKTFRYRHY